MILFCGIPSEPSLGLVIEQVSKRGVPYLVFYQRRFSSSYLQFEVRNGDVSGLLQYQGETYRLEQFTAVYSRLVDFRFLPEVEGAPPGSPLFEHCRALHDTMIRGSEIAPSRVVNRSTAMGSNYSKPYQAQLIRQHGFSIPETLITNNPSLVREFLKRHKRVVYKSICNIRSIVKTFTEKDFIRLNLIRLCPVQFQQFIKGTNIRVHTIGEKAIATSIKTDSTDYRYAYLKGDSEQLKPMQLPDKLTQHCIALSRALGLSFAGIDLIVTPDNEVFCLEVNPSPAFSYYEKSTGQPIAREVAEFLIYGK
jgi:hypothetical protein